MSLLLLFGRLLLAIVFLFAGLAKLVDRSAFRQTVVDFGCPDRWVPPASRSLPLIECVVGLALIPVASAWWGALGALLLLLLFVGAISVNLARGKRPRCQCF